MALPPYVFEQARAQAAEHVQINVTQVGAVRPLGGSTRGIAGQCPVSGIVVQSFRGRLRIGETVSFEVACASRDADLPVGGTVWTDLDALRAARVVEAYFNRVNGAVEVARDQVYIVPAARRTPWCTVEGCTIPPPPAPPPPPNPLAAFWARLFPAR